jgi:hypothetical protein
MSESEDPQAAEEPPRARAKREQIRAAAQRLFLELGYERASMDAIARAAGVSFVEHVAQAYSPTYRQFPIGNYVLKK